MIWSKTYFPKRFLKKQLLHKQKLFVENLKELTVNLYTHEYLMCYTS